MIFLCFSFSAFFILSFVLSLMHVLCVFMGGFLFVIRTYVCMADFDQLSISLSLSLFYLPICTSLLGLFACLADTGVSICMCVCIQPSVTATTIIYEPTTEVIIAGGPTTSTAVCSPSPSPTSSK